MYEDKIKKELFEKIRKYNEIGGKLCDIATDHPFDPMDNIEFEGLSAQFSRLLDEINELLIDTKYLPLFGLTEEQKSALDYFLKGSEEPMIFESATIDGREVKVTKFENNEAVEKHLDLSLLKLKEEMKERIHKVKTLRMTAYLDPKTSHFYNEVIRCYIYGAFEASCVLCRAITETLAKRFIAFKGYGHLLTGTKGKSKAMSVQEICLKTLKIDEKIVALYTKIGNKADKVLHQKELIGEDVAIELIELLQSFIKGFPKQI